MNLCLDGAERPGDRATKVPGSDDGVKTQGPRAPELAWVDRPKPEVGGIWEARREHEDPVPLHGPLIRLQVQGYAVLRPRVTGQRSQDIGHGSQ